LEKSPPTEEEGVEEIEEEVEEEVEGEGDVEMTPMSSGCVTPVKTERVLKLPLRGGRRRKRD